LVIDDNQAIHADFKKILQPVDASTAGLDAAAAELFGEAPSPSAPFNFEVDSAHSGEEGLALVQAARAQGHPYALAFVDVRMAPGWNGIETTAHICQHDPDIQIVICTAYSDYSWEEMIAKLGQSDRLVILKKPFDTVEVLQLSHAMTEKWELGQKARARMDQLEQMVAGRTRELEDANEKLKAEISERAQVEDALRQSQKMEAIGQLAGGIAHDFNNLLTVIRGYVQCLTSEMPQNPNVSEALHEIDVAAERAAKLTSQMLLFSRKKRIQSQSLNLNDVIAQFGTMLRRLLGENIALTIKTTGKPLTIHADPVMIEMVVLNLAVNARDAMPQGGQLIIRTEEIEISAEGDLRGSKAHPGSYACISVVDTGCGIAPDVLPHLFEPFFTTKEVGKGTGLGLATVYGIAKQHSGWVEIESEPGHGAQFKVFFPINLKKSEPGTSFKSKAQILGGTETILLVEDEPALRRLARTVLQRHGYCIHEACSGAEALSVWSGHASKIDLLVTDMIMPGGISGRQLADQLQHERGDLKVIYTTGYSPDTISQDLALEEGVNFLAKPYPSEKLAQIVRRRLDEPAQLCLPATV